ncbi:MAG: YlbF family regulator [Tepidisphaerales bacterium]
MADLNEILDQANKLGELVASHPAVQRYKDAQKALASDPEAARLLSEFERELVNLSRQEQSGIPVTDAQQQKLQALQSRIVSNLRIKALNLAEVEFYDLLRKVNQTVLRHVSPSGASAGAAGAGVGPAGVRGGSL